MAEKQNVSDAEWRRNRTTSVVQNGGETELSDAEWRKNRTTSVTLAAGFATCVLSSSISTRSRCFSALVRTGLAAASSSLYSTEFSCKQLCCPLEYCCIEVYYLLASQALACKTKSMKADSPHVEISNRKMQKNSRRVFRSLSLDGYANSLEPKQN